MPFLSICIPTFNRCDKVYKLVNDILLYTGKEIEVIVLDNCSTDNTNNLLNKIIDDRFSFVQNEVNIGGILNPLKVISLASGEFSVLCLDKDYLDYRGIEKLIKSIKIDPEVVFGHCALNIKNERQDIIYDKGFRSVMSMAYLSRHPSGMFYKTNEYNKLDILKSIFIERKNFSFYFDLINGEMAMIGKSLLINLPAFYSESKEDAVKSLSFTYDINNVYFSPAKRRIEFDAYLESVNSLELSSNEKFKLIFRLYGQGLMLSTFVYKNMMADDYVCLHNRIAKQKVGFIELWKLNFEFSLHFFKKSLIINFIQKILIILCLDVKFTAKSFLSK